MDDGQGNPKPTWRTCDGLVGFSPRDKLGTDDAETFVIRYTQAFLMYSKACLYAFKSSMVRPRLVSGGIYYSRKSVEITEPARTSLMHNNQCFEDLDRSTCS